MLTHVTKMNPVNESVYGVILMKLLINHRQTTDVNKFQGQPSKAKGLGGVGSQRNKMPTILYKYRFSRRFFCHVILGHPPDGRPMLQLQQGIKCPPFCLSIFLKKGKLIC